MEVDSHPNEDSAMESDDSDGSCDEDKQLLLIQQLRKQVCLFHFRNCNALGAKNTMNYLM